MGSSMLLRNDFFEGGVPKMGAFRDENKCILTVRFLN